MVLNLGVPKQPKYIFKNNKTPFRRLQVFENKRKGFDSHSWRKERQRFDKLKFRIPFQPIQDWLRDLVKKFSYLTYKLITLWCFYMDTNLDIESIERGKMSLQNLIGANHINCEIQHNSLERSRRMQKIRLEKEKL